MLLPICGTFEADVLTPVVGNLLKPAAIKFGLYESNWVGKEDTFCNEEDVEDNEDEDDEYRDDDDEDCGRFE